MIEVMAAVSLANSAFNALKSGLEKGKELQDMGETLGTFWDAHERITQASIENETATYAKKLLNGKSIESQALEITIAKTKAREMENELREFLIYSGQGEFYREMLRERRNIKNERLRAAMAKAVAKKDAMDLALIVFLFALGGGVLAAIVALIAEAQ
ncbi:MAG TPA: hypothetical protein VMW91_05070 [Desulfosporosinus sp.]|nr:hypothetical protein [Desulfosporosinus sp.]